VGCHGWVGCQWRRWRFVSVRRIGKVRGRKEKKKKDGEERENNNILIKLRRN
jgi:hypothetical protein